MSVEANTSTPNACAPSVRARWTPTTNAISCPTSSPPRMKLKFRSSRLRTGASDVMAKANVADDATPQPSRPNAAMTDSTMFAPVRACGYAPAIPVWPPRAQRKHALICLSADDLGPQHAQLDELSLD